MSTPSRAAIAEAALKTGSRQSCTQTTLAWRGPSSETSGSGGSRTRSRFSLPCSSSLRSPPAFPASNSSSIPSPALFCASPSIYMTLSTGPRRSTRRSAWRIMSFASSRATVSDAGIRRRSSCPNVRSAVKGFFAWCRTSASVWRSVSPCMATANRCCWSITAASARASATFTSVLRSVLDHSRAKQRGAVGQRRRKSPVWKSDGRAGLVCRSHQRVRGHQIRRVHRGKEHVVATCELDLATAVVFVSSLAHPDADGLGKHRYGNEIQVAALRLLSAQVQRRSVDAQSGLEHLELTLAGTHELGRYGGESLREQPLQSLLLRAICSEKPKRSSSSGPHPQRPSGQAEEEPHSEPERPSG
eukprot:scaffold245_cov256-Pinguiococcus_pyrenoidosus.AAC.43